MIRVKEEFDCNVVYDAEGNVAALNVYRLPKLASFDGAISAVDIEKSTITITTDDGDKVFTTNLGTSVIVNGSAGSLGLVDALVAGGAKLLGAVIYDTAKNDTVQTVYINDVPNLTEGTGTIESVNIEKSTVTIMTDKGERTFVVDAKTGQFLNGEVCSLQDVLDATEHGQEQPLCQVLYFTDKDGKLVYIDVTDTRNP